MPDAIISPTPGKHPKSIGNRCAMVASPMDVDNLSRLLGLTSQNSRQLLLSRLFYTHQTDSQYAIIGPFIGSAYATMLLETAIAWGAKEVVFLGWCGAVSPSIHVGDIIIPDSAFCDEGVSKDYLRQNCLQAPASHGLQDRLKSRLRGGNVSFYQGRVWSTDAIFRETHEKIAFYQAKDALAVEMEASALFSVGLFRNISVGCILVVSDELWSGRWVQGFADPKFTASRDKAYDAVRDFLTDHRQ